jgi:hypothetical protein
METKQDAKIVRWTQDIDANYLKMGSVRNVQRYDYNDY